MATKKKVVKMRDLKPAKDAKGGVSLNRGNRQLDGNRKQLDGNRKQLDGSTRQGANGSTRYKPPGGPTPRGGFILSG